MHFELSEGTSILDDAMKLASSGDIAGAMRTGCDGLRAIRTELRRDQWLRFVKESVLVHPFRALAHSDPITRHGFTKPRGYPGDAAHHDMIYGETPFAEVSAQDTGWDVFEHTFNTPASRAVRERREILATKIDAVAARQARPIRVLSIAAGHLREASNSSAFQSGNISEFVAVDQDHVSLRTIEHSYPNRRITTVEASIRDLLRRRPLLQDFDLVYAAGLFDYLGDELAKELASRMFEFLRPGGEMLIANFCPSIADSAYMEALMDWHLIYRSDRQFEEVLSSIPANRIAATTRFFDSLRQVVYLCLTHV
jgi:hypothetical protein